MLSGDFATYADFAAIYAGLASLLAGNNTTVILALSLALAVLSSSALGHFAATHGFAPLVGHTSQVFKSDVDQDTLPTKAPFVGIGYQSAPDN